MKQGFRDQNQHTGDTPGHQLSMNYHARLDRLPQPPLVGKQNTGGQSRAHLMGDVKLMRDEINPSADEAAGRRPATTVRHLQGPTPKGED